MKITFKDQSDKTPKSAKLELLHLMKAYAAKHEAVEGEILISLDADGVLDGDFTAKWINGQPLEDWVEAFEDWESLRQTLNQLFSTNQVVFNSEDTTSPPSLKAKVIKRLTELEGTIGDDAHPTYAIIETMSMGGKPMAFRLIRWKPDWDMLTDPNPGNVAEVDCQKPSDDEQWERIALYLGMSDAAETQG